MPLLELHRDYTREGVHAIFSPHTRFTLSSVKVQRSPMAISFAH